MREKMEEDFDDEEELFDDTIDDLELDI